MIHIDSDSSDPSLIVVSKTFHGTSGAWAALNTLLSRGVTSGSHDTLIARTEVFFAEIDGISSIHDRFPKALTFGDRLKSRFFEISKDQRRMKSAISSPVGDLEITNLEQELIVAGFTRALHEFQLNNLGRLLQLPHGADFSVPGAGKTTVALAGHNLLRHRKEIDRLVVVAPIAAFQAWQDDAAECFASVPKFHIHSGTNDIIPRNTEILLTNYNRVSQDYSGVGKFISSGYTQLILDEAHRIKRGSSGVHARAILDLSYVAKRRDILTGTPAPQSAYDLVALIGFLYPGISNSILPAAIYEERNGRDPEVLRVTQQAISRYFVRTPKSQLNLPTPSFKVVRHSMGEIQSAIYSALVGRYRGKFQLETKQKRELDRLGRITMYLLEAATNPALLTAGSDANDDDSLAHRPLDVRGDEPISQLLRDYGQYETPWKYSYVKNLVADANAHGEKILVWTTFVRNIKALTRILEEFNPAIVHGGIPSETSKNSTTKITRESEIHRFKNDPNCGVLIANPAACGEGISLHHWCHHAVYLERTFNAGQFLQSQDRIHRLGLAPETSTKFTLLISEGTIDEVVESRLTEKVVALSTLMNDPGLVRVALPEQDEVHNNLAIFQDDAESVTRHIIRCGNDVT